MGRRVEGLLLIGGSYAVAALAAWISLKPWVEGKLVPEQPDLTVPIAFISAVWLAIAVLSFVRLKWFGLLTLPGVLLLNAGPIAGGLLIITWIFFSAHPT
jgi:hypothetical protein